MRRYQDTVTDGNLVFGQQVLHQGCQTKKGQLEKDKPRIPSGNVSAFQDYTSTMMSALNNSWKPPSKGTTKPTWTTVPPLVFLSTLGTPVSRPRTGEGVEEEQVKMNFSAVDKTILVPKGRSGAESTGTPIKFTEELQNGGALRVRPQGWSLLRTLGFDAQDEETQSPDFYMPDGQGKN